MYKKYLIALTLAIAIFVPTLALANETIEFGTADDTFSLFGAGDWIANAQKFQTTLDEGSAVVRLSMFRLGSPSGTLELGVHNVDSGLPGSDIYDSVSIPVTDIASGTTASDCVEYEFPELSTDFLSANEYFFVVREGAGFTGDGSNGIYTCWNAAGEDGGYRQDTDGIWHDLGFGALGGSAEFTSIPPTPTTTPTTTPQTVDNSVQSLFYGYILFMTGFVVIIWVLRGRRTH